MFNLEINARIGFMKYGRGVFGLIRLLELCVFEVLISIISAVKRICVDRKICILTHIWTMGSKSPARYLQEQDDHSKCRLLELLTC